MPYDTIKFFGSPAELLRFTRRLRAAEMLDKLYEQNVRPKEREA